MAISVATALTTAIAATFTRLQPVVIANSMLGIDAVYGKLPSFLTDQYGLGWSTTGTRNRAIMTRL